METQVANYVDHTLFGEKPNGFAVVADSMNKENISNRKPTLRDLVQQARTVPVIFNMPVSGMDGAEVSNSVRPTIRMFGVVDVMPSNENFNRNSTARLFNPNQSDSKVDDAKYTTSDGNVIHLNQG